MGNFDFGFIAVLVPAALADSINPCVFAILFVMLSSILHRTGSQKKALFTGLLFATSIFISYYLMGVGILKVLTNYTVGYARYIQLGAAILALIVGLLNIKDFFWYDKLPPMEMPKIFKKFSGQVIKKMTTPIGGFFIGFVLSLFLLPCTSGPYFTILGYLASENISHALLGHIYMIIYNLIFILPLIIITFLVFFGIKSVGELKEYREYYIREIHLAVGLLMLGLSFYLFFEVFFHI